MKTTLIAELQTIPSSLRQIQSTAKVVMVFVAAISVLSVIISLSGDTQKKTTAFFFSENEAIMATWQHGADWGDVHEAYPYTTGQEETTTINDNEYGQ